MADNRDIQIMKEQIIRIEERFNSMSQSLIKLEKQYEEDFKELKKIISDNYVTTEQFSPVQKVVYSTIGTILIAIITSILALVLRK